MKKIKKSISGSKEDFELIDRYVDTLPDVNRSQFLIESALLNIANMQDRTYVSHKERKEKIMCHVVNLSNLSNEIKNDEPIREKIQQEVLDLWRSLN